jgi:hypothetical protein
MRRAGVPVGQWPASKPPRLRHPRPASSQTAVMSPDHLAERASNERHFSVKIWPVTPTPNIMRIHKTAGQEPFAAGSRMATHSTSCVIGKVSAWTQALKQQVREAFGSRMRASGRPERQMSVTAVRRFGTDKTYVGSARTIWRGMAPRSTAAPPPVRSLTRWSRVGAPTVDPPRVSRRGALSPACRDRFRHAGCGRPTGSPR